MANDFKCPYFISAKKSKTITCEFAVIKPPDEQTKAEFLSGFCGSGGGYRRCPLYRTMDDYYQRKYPDWKGE